MKNRIPIHPYIELSVYSNNVGGGGKKTNYWEDPKTGLRYPTDLSSYLGHDRKVTGRHTLVGVGQYTRTVFNIKVREQ